jgi:hypothetical protein
MLLVILSVAPWVACRSSCGKAPEPAAAQAPQASPPAAAGRLAMPATLLQLDKSAYHTRIELTADAIYLLTMDGAFRLAPGQPPQESKLELSDNGVATPSAFIYWSKGSFWLAPKKGGPPGRIADVKERPIFIVSVEERFAWIAPDGQGRHTVYTLRQGEPYALHTLAGTAAAATMVDDVVVFVERVEGGWRLGSVARGGGPANFTTTRTGPYPAMLTAAGDVYYYFWDDKKTSEVRAVSPDLRSERVVASHVTCSPLAVADRLFCVSMEGLFEISPSSGLPKLVYPGDGPSTTTIAADRNRIVWVRDAGAEKLEVKLIDRNAIP